MHITQKKFGRKIDFIFHKDYINMILKDKSGTTDNDFFYAEIPFKKQESVEQNDWSLCMAVMWIVIWIVNVSRILLTGKPMDGSWILLVISAPFFLHYLASRVKYTVLFTKSGNLFIIQDKKHDQIYSEIMNRRKIELLRMYGNVNSHSDYETELEKFGWLRRHGVIDSIELDEKINEILTIYPQEQPAINPFEIH